MRLNSKIKNLRASFDGYKIDSLLVTSDANIRYLTDFPAEESWLLVTRKKVIYITDSRYDLVARQSMKGAQVVCYKKSMAEALYNISRIHNIKKIGLDERTISLFQYKKITQLFGKWGKFIYANHLLDELRELKQASEMNRMKMALDVHAQAHRFLKRVIKPNISERKVFLKLENFIKSKGFSFSFDPIIASGPNSCYPHAKITERKIRQNDVVLVDMGIEVQGYKSDLTRMFFLGKIPESIHRMYYHVTRSQRKAIEKIQPGAVIGDIDYQARNYLKKNKLAKYFGHALGHGIGLEVHESPRISKDNAALLKQGMVITIEPGVYIPGKVGIRVEDMILVKKGGCEVLSDHIN